MANRITFKLAQEYIELYKLLKLLDIAESGGQAKAFVEQGEAMLNSQPETRKRAKIRPGDRVEIKGYTIEVVAEISG